MNSGSAVSELPASASPLAPEALSGGAVSQSMDSSLERLRSSAVNLNRFASGLRGKYALDIKEPIESGGEWRHASLQSEIAVELSGDSNTRMTGSVSSQPAALSSKNTAVKYGRSKSLAGRSLVQSVATFFRQTARQPEVFTDHCSGFAREILKIVSASSELEPVRGDKRFRDAVWKENFVYHSVLQIYLAWDKELSGWVDDLDLEEADRRRAEFLKEQVSALLAPTNSPFNPAAVKRAYQTGGKSVVHGLSNLVRDWQTNHGMPTQVRSDAYKVGGNLANTPGAVVHRSDVLELIQYQMEDGQSVQKRPVLVVPPQLNKFYVFDLSPKNSLLKYLQSQSIQPFVISWRNPSQANAHWDLDRYVSELEKAVEVMCEITGSDSINLASACAGGITSMALLGYLQAANKPLVHSHSLFVTALQADDSSALGMFATREAIELGRKHAQAKGFMSGKELSHIFAWLRPTDLVWNYWVNNYLLGKEPPSMDVLYWDNDSTRLPAALHSDFLDIFIDDGFAEPGQLVVKGYPVDIKNIGMDFYCVGGEEDYLMPWKKCFEVPGMLDTRCTFVLSTSGHIQSILRPPGIANTYYYTSDLDAGQGNETTAEQWLQGATRHNGSWWEHWRQWLLEHSDGVRTEPARLGSDRYPPLCQAPGLYVNEKVD